MHDTTVDTVAAVLAALLFAAIASAYVVVQALAPWWRRVRASDRTVSALAAGVRLPDEDTAAALLAAWYADTRAAPIPELVDLDTAVELITHRPQE